MRYVRPIFVVAIAVAIFLLAPAGDSGAVPGAGGTTVFSVAGIGPAWDITPAPSPGGPTTCTSADALTLPGLGPVGPCGLRVAPAPPGPVPDGTTTAPIDLGLGGPFTDDVDASSLGEAVGVTAVADFDFSVDAAPANGGVTVGAPVPAACAPFVPNVTTSAVLLEAQGDIFTTAGVPVGCNVQAPGCPGLVLCDEAALGLLAPNPAAPGVPPLDNVDALHEVPVPAPPGPCTAVGGTVPSPCAAFSVDAGSPVLAAIPPAPPGFCLGAPADAASILVPPGTPAIPPCLPAPGCLGPTPCIAVPSGLLGLTPGDDIDAVCWWDADGDGLADVPSYLPGPGDYYVFSLTPASASVVGFPFFSPAAIIGNPIFAPVVVAAPGALGLLPTDNVDGLICHDLDPDGDGAPNLFDNDDDGDGYWDTDEIAKGSDPLAPGSTPEHCDGIDNDGDLVIDEPPPLSGRLIPDPLCAPAVDLPPPDLDLLPNAIDLDDDGDGFTDAAELSMTTDELDACPVPPAPIGYDAWPPDANGDGDADVGDVISLFFGVILTPANYNARADSNGDGDNDVGDVIALFGGGIILTTC